MQAEPSRPAVRALQRVMACQVSPNRQIRPNTSGSMQHRGASPTHMTPGILIFRCAQVEHNLMCQVYPVRNHWN